MSGSGKASSPSFGGSASVSSIPEFSKLDSPGATQSVEVRDRRANVGAKAHERLLYVGLAGVLLETAQHVEPCPLEPLRDVALLRPAVGRLHADEHPPRPVQRHVRLAAGRAEAVLRFEIVARRLDIRDQRRSERE